MAVRPWRTTEPAASHKGLPLALFTDIEPDRREPRRRRLGWGILSIALVGITVVALIPAPFVIEQPGPVFDVLGDVTVAGKSVPLIEIPTAKTYPTNGVLDMLTVSIRGNRDSLPTWLDIATAYLNPSETVLPVDLVYPAGVSVTDSTKQGAVDMANSQKEAIAAALTELGYTFPSTLTVVALQAGGPSQGVLQVGDVVLSVDGTTFPDVSGLRAAIAKNGTSKPADLVIKRAGVEKRVSVSPVLSAGTAPVPIVGIVVGSDYQFPVDVTIQLENVGGPSAGQMFALGIIDKLTAGSLTGGKSIAGTGTITATGAVGPIGGIQQKLYGAKAAGAEYFLAPSANCGEVTGHVPAGLTVFSVATLKDSLAALKAVAAGADLATIPRCPAG